VLFSQSSSAQQSHAPYQDPSFEVKETKDEGRYALWIMPPKLIEATVAIETRSENMTLNRKTPFTIDVSSAKMDLRRANNILQAKQTDTGQRYEFYWTYNWMIGLRGGKPDPSILYALPFDSGTRCKVNQSYFGAYSHGSGSQNEYAVDFGLPEGTPVCAAREGIVVAVRSDSGIGGRDPQVYKNTANYVVIKHADGSYGSYLHLMQGSTLVKPGQTVKRGEHIAKVGATGAVTCPHLHFDVSVPLDGYSRKSYPITFDTASGTVSKPIEGDTYVAR